MEWKTGHPEKDGRYLVCKINRGGWTDITILTWNTHYCVWDSEDGDDFECRPEMVSHWMELPKKPKLE